LYAVTGFSGLGQTSSNPLTNIETDISNFGFGEWAVLGLGAFALFAMASATSRGVSAVKGHISKRQSKLKRRREAKAELAEVGYGFPWAAALVIGGLAAFGLIIYSAQQQQQTGAAQ
jgi:hypothetical protein